MAFPTFAELFYPWYLSIHQILHPPPLVWDSASHMFLPSFLVFACRAAVRTSQVFLVCYASPFSCGICLCYYRVKVLKRNIAVNRVRWAVSKSSGRSRTLGERASEDAWDSWPGTSSLWSDTWLGNDWPSSKASESGVFPSRRPSPASTRQTQKADSHSWILASPFRVQLVRLKDNQFLQSRTHIWKVRFNRCQTAANWILALTIEVDDDLRL